MVARRPRRHVWWLIVGTLALLEPAAVVAEVRVAANKNTKETKKNTKKKSKKKSEKQKEKRAAAKPAVKRGKQEVTVPIDIGVGPAFHMFTGLLQDDETFHTGARISLAAIIDQETIRRFDHKIPKKYRGLARKVEEVRIRPWPVPLIPDTIYVSPSGAQTQMYGANWRPIGFDFSLIRRPFRLSVGLGIDITYNYINSEFRDPEVQSEDVDDTTHFFRPGADLRAEIYIPFGQWVGISGGWTSFFYPPQRVGGPVFELGDADESIWHVGQAFGMIHIRIPYTTRL